MPPLPYDSTAMARDRQEWSAASGTGLKIMSVFRRFSSYSYVLESTMASSDGMNIRCLEVYGRAELPKLTFCECGRRRAALFWMLSLVAPEMGHVKDLLTC